jgi:putative integral membrane protein (TIGR02587 family)
VLDALAAFGVGFVLSAAVLAVFGVITPDMRAVEIVGDIAICAVPASIGALLAGKQFTEREIGTREKREAGYLGRLFIMVVGALFLAFNVAPTEEMVLIAYKMTAWQSLALAAASMGVLHLLVFSLGFPGEKGRRTGSTARSVLAYTVPGYAIALVISYFALWTFMRLEGTPPVEQARVIVVLAFPAALGAATARLVI